MTNRGLKRDQEPPASTMAVVWWRSNNGQMAHELHAPYKAVYRNLAQKGTPNPVFAWKMAAADSGQRWQPAVDNRQSWPALLPSWDSDILNNNTWVSRTLTHSWNVFIYWELKYKLSFYNRWLQQRDKTPKYKIT